MQFILIIILLLVIISIAFLIYKQLHKSKIQLPPVIGMSGGKTKSKGGEVLTTSTAQKQFPQTSVLTNYVLRATPLKFFVWTEKTDGVRTEISIEGKKVLNYNDKHKELAKLKKEASGTVLNTEFLNDKYYIFDSPKVNGKDISEKHFLERYEVIKEFIKEFDPDEKTFKLKKYDPITKLDELKEFIQNTVSPNTGANVDGVILQRTDLPYYSVSSYKYKRPVMNTIDFLLKYLPERGEFYLYLWGSYRNVVYNMQKLPKINRFSKRHTGVDLHDKKYPDKFPILFSSSLLANAHIFIPKEHWNRKGYKREDIITINALMNKIVADPIKYDGKIIEMSWSESGWVPYRERFEKPKPNGYAVGDSICEILFSPVDFSENRYFESNIEDSELTEIFHKVNKHIRKKMIGRLLKEHPTKTILDIAGGRGGDSNYFIENGVTSIFAVDADREAIVSYKNRLAKMNKTGIIFNGFGWSLCEDNTSLISDIQNRYEYRDPFPVAVMDYAIHYISDSAEKLSELSRTLGKLLSDDGVFMFTYFDGDMMLSQASDNAIKLHSFTIKINPDAGTVMMPLPTIDKTGYREEPLTTRERLASLNIKILDDYYPAVVWGEELKELDPKEDILDLSRYIRVIVCQVLKTRLIS